MRIKTTKKGYIWTIHQMLSTLILAWIKDENHRRATHLISKKEN
jgi:hypothetical protein